MGYNKTAWKAQKQDTEKDLRASLDEAAKALAEELQRGASERLVKLLQFAAHFHHYSIGNQILIEMQCPGASQVAGYRTWEQKGYHVEKGQKGIRILAPRPYRTTDEKTGEEKSHVYFRSVCVFDVSQLNPEEVAAKPIPTFYYDLGSDEQSEELATRIVERMRSTIRVEFRDDFTGEMQGWSKGGHVAVRAGLPSVNRIRTLVHEWAHELLHHGETDMRSASKTLKECHAEATSYTVLAHFGIHNPLSSDYLTMWGATPELLMAELAQVQKAASVIITALEGKSEQGEGSDAA